MHASICNSALALAAAVVIGGASAASAQTPDKRGPIAYGHHHVNATSIEAHQKFWIEALGGSPLKIRDTDNVKFPGVIVRINKQAPTGGTKGTTVNHVGFQVPNLRKALDRIKAAGFPLVTKAEVTSAAEIKDDIAFIGNQNAYIAFTMGPDDTKVELFENQSLSVPIALHHIHFAAQAQDIEPMRAWYAKWLKAEPRRVGNFETAELPDVSLRWGASAQPVAPTKGRVLDHIGFEVTNIKAVNAELERAGVKIDQTLAYVPDIGVWRMHIIDPWGTRVELTEGLDKFLK